MRFFDVKLGFNPVTVMAGLGIALLAPPIISTTPKLLRSAVKTVIKAGYILSGRMRFVYWSKEPSIVLGGAEKRKESGGGRDDRVYVSSGGKKYHREGCSFARAARQALSLAEALAAGYEPCKLCGD